MTSGGPPLQRRLRLACAVVAATFAAVAASVVSPERPAAASDPVGAALCLGAASMEPGSACVPTRDGPVFPRPEDAATDRSPSYDHDCQVRPDFTARWTCEYGDLSARRNVALVGNSHAVHWLPALHEVGLRRGFKVTTFVSAACFATTTRIAMFTPEHTENCHDWGRWVRESTATGEYDLIVQAERTYRWPADGGDPDTVFTHGYREHLQRWHDAGRTVLVIRDTPMPHGDVPTCLLRNADDYTACTADRAVHLQRDPLVDAARSFRSDRMRIADLTPYFCAGDGCPAVIGRVVVYFDSSHMTATYAATLAPYLDEHVADALRVDADRELL